MKIDLTLINEKKQELENHSLLTSNIIQSKEDLKLFMENHVFAVLDFMSLLKNIQHNVVPSGVLWVPNSRNRSECARLINEIVLCEETDISLDKKTYVSHFDLYLMAMLEVSADTSSIEMLPNYINVIDMFAGSNKTVRNAPGIKFIKHTMATIPKGPHCVAASFCYGRETVLPELFRKILKQLDIKSIDAPKFHYYLERHIEVDGDDHGPASEKIVELLCENNPTKVHQAEQAAISAIQARIEFFDEIQELILRQRFTGK